MLVGLVVLVALLAPLIATHDPERLSITTRLRPPSEQSWFGTDEFGRDIYSRIVYGSRISLAVAATVIVVATSIGVTLGVFGAYVAGAGTRPSCGSLMCSWRSLIWCWRWRFRRRSGPT